MSSFKSVIGIIGVFLSLPSLAQNVLIQSESAFGKLTIFADHATSSETFYHNGKEIHVEEIGYTHNQIDSIRLNINYDCFLAFEDNTNEGIRDTMLLQIGKRYTKFYSAKLHLADSLLQFCKGKGLGNVLKNAIPIFVNDVYYIDIATKELSFVCRLATEDFEYIEKLPDISWNISDIMKVICGYNCYKATGSFRGREYEAWYTEDIPAPVGPWKLSGLPGAILEARDTEGLCSFEAKSVQLNKSIMERTDYQYFKISRSQYNSMIQKYFDAPLRFQSMHLSKAPGTSITPPPNEKPLRKVTTLEKY
ncbi:MAG: GLPGLI family protein [Bacteroidales bacterium]|nr:GLPGLI family protein [Bacteroidales bacterium]MBQ5980253.1 GLPGLI family protein [Bacteroidales bacterium]MBQ6185014.1 GLPGLI family protein [Bacteroidales bacterium]